MNEGILISPKALEKITEKNLEDFLEQAKSKRELVFSPKEESLSPEETVVSIKKTQKKQKLSPQDYAAYYNSRFEGLREILAKKLEAVSVSNAKKSGGHITTIGMVRDQTPRGFTIEDTTGWMEVITKSEDVAPDDVIAVKGSVKEEKVFAEEIAWPDVSMNHSHSRPSLQVTLSEKDGSKDSITITPDTLSLFGKKHTFPNPGRITISKDSQTVTVLVYTPEKSVTTKEAFAWLKKRHLFPSRDQIRGADDPFLIEPVPNLLWIVQPEKLTENYKGVIIVACDGKEPAEVDLATGEVKFLE